MEQSPSESAVFPRVYRSATVLIALTLAACLAALAFRTPLRSRYWARQVERARSIDERAAALTHLCNAGDAGRWGIDALLSHSDAEIRQFGILVLQHVPSTWSRRRLLQMLEDPSQAVAELAALGLAIHGDEAIIPELERLYVQGDESTASTACIALERLATPEAVAALERLASHPADPVRLAALIDALGGIASPTCVAPLLGLLDDHRPSAVPARADRLLEQLAPLAAQRGLVNPSSASEASRPAIETALQTVAERAAAALAQITGLAPPFASDLPDEQRQAAEHIWRDWAAAQEEAPSSPIPDP